MSTEFYSSTSPKYFSPSILLLYIFSAENRKYFDKEKYPLYNRAVVSEIIKSFKLRKKLLLNKIVKFNNKYYSSPISPGLPSKAYDFMVARGGLNFDAYGTEHKQQVDSAFLAITNECPLGCKHCYEKFNLNSSHSIPEEKWIEIIHQLQQRGTNIIILTGGEPLSEFDKLISILRAGNKDLSDFHLHTSGFSITLEKALELKRAGLAAAAVGLNDVNPERHDKIRAKGSFDAAVNALKIFNQAGIFTYVNLCAEKELIHSGDLFKYLDLVKSLNVSMIQLLEPRPCGGYLKNNSDEFLTQEERNILVDFTFQANCSRKYKMHPLIYYVAHIEGKEQMGCTMGGLSHFYIDSVGNVNPCVFMPVSFGNVMEDDFLNIFEKMRSAVPYRVHAECPSLTLAETINKKINNKIPIPYSEISDDWKKLFEKN